MTEDKTTACKVCGEIGHIDDYAEANGFLVWVDCPNQGSEKVMAWWMEHQERAMAEHGVLQP